MRISSSLLAICILISIVGTGFCQVPTPTRTPNPIVYKMDLNSDGSIDAHDLFLFEEGWHDRSLFIPTPTPLPSVIINLPNLASGALPLKLVSIPAGTFYMGTPDTERSHSSDETPVHPVAIGSDFFIGETEITQAQWLAVMGNWPGSPPSVEYGVGDDYPAYYVSFDDAQTFIAELNSTGQGTFRLPTEAEWEYACRAGTSTRFFFGDSLECADDCADCLAGNLPGVRTDYMWYCSNAGSKPVRQKLPNAFGLYDMSGNIWERCQDWYQSDFYNTPEATGISPVCANSASDNRVIRGGCWADDAKVCRSGLRYYSYPPYRYFYIGFRLVMEVPGSATPTAISTETPTFSYTPQPTSTETVAPTFTPTPLETILIDLPNLPAEAQSLKLIRIPAGTFNMGTPDTERSRQTDEGPVHLVTIGSDFYLGETEITQAQWLSVMGSWPDISPNSSYGLGNDYPAYYVSWSDVQHFIYTINGKGQGTFRLPTEAEWEYACRSGTSTRFYFGDSLGCDDMDEDCAAGTLPGNRSDYMWFDFNYNNPYGIKPVRQLLPNAYGLYDMSGNLQEWCQDWYQSDFYSDPDAVNTSPVCTNNSSGDRVLRGGYWAHFAKISRSGARGWIFPSERSNAIGFRLVMDAPSSVALTATFTRTPTMVFFTPTPSPTATPMPSNITVDLPSLPSGASPLKLIHIPAGIFYMGSPDTERSRSSDEGPLHMVTIGSPFYLGETEITQAQWLAVMGSWPDTAPGCCGEGNDYPTYYVSWNDVQNFITALNGTGQGTFRLPTEAEWEYACRAETSTRFFFGDSLGCDEYCSNCAAGTLSGNRTDYMWYCGNSGITTHPVRQLIPNAFGLYDMSGNVWEWCQDWYQGNFYSTPDALVTSPACNNSASGLRVIRGGYWSYSAAYCRSAARGYTFPTDRYSSLGFRLVMAPQFPPTLTPTITKTQTSTRTPTPSLTATPMPSNITINLPNLPSGALPLKLIHIPAGIFDMGSPDTERCRWDNEGPLHMVTIGSDFYMGEIEITQAQWGAVMGSNPVSNWGVGNDYPVYNVSWNDCQSFITALNSTSQGTFRLPTEAEWEYACRAGTTTRFYFGDSLDCEDDCSNCSAGSIPGNRSDFMWYCGNSGVTSHPVRQLIPNAFGLYDMSGNEWEWCQDWYQSDFYSTPDALVTSPVCNNSASGMRVLRSGGWAYSATLCRSAFRFYSKPSDRLYYVGLRLVRLP